MKKNRLTDIAGIAKFDIPDLFKIRGGTSPEGPGCQTANCTSSSCVGSSCTTGACVTFTCNSYACMTEACVTKSEAPPPTPDI